MRLIKWVTALAAIVLTLFGAAYLWLDSTSGRAFVARQISGYELENGLRFEVGRIDGSLYRAAMLKDVRIRDPQGVFARLPEVELDWHPLRYLRGIVAVNRLAAREMRVQRLPELRIVPDRGEPLLPDLDIRVGELAIERIVLAAGIAGEERVARLTGTAHLADRRAVVDAALLSDRGDRLLLKLDAVPDDDQFDLALAVNAPADGMIAGLSGRAVPMTAQLSGNGTWQRWDGRLTGRAGAEPVADVALTARAGQFSAKGFVTAAPIMAEGAVARLFGARTDIDLSATLAERVADIKGSLASSAFVVGADGVIDLGKGRFGDLALDMRVARPDVLAPNVSGRDVRARLLLNGDFAAPVVRYNLTAARLAFDATTLEGLEASGETRSRADRMIIPVNARARRMSGINPAFRELLTNVRFNGDLAYANGRVLSDNLKVKSDRVDATAVLVGDIANGVYSVGLKGRVGAYRVESVGLFNIDADVALRSQARGFVLDGTVRGRSTRLFSPGVQNFLGGQMFATAAITYGTDGVLRIRSANVVAPQFRLNRGSGTYVPGSGRVVFDGSGFSNAYGPLTVALTGNFDQPRARITATRPGFGVGLANVMADVRRSRTGYAVGFTGTTDYGPVRGDLDILAGDGPLTIDILRGDMAGIGVSGRVRQVAAGPFAGTLTADGSGFNGTIALSAEGQYQRAIVAATASNMVLEGRQRLAVGRGIVDADIILFDEPQITADVQVENALLATTEIVAGRGKIAYRGGNGTVQLLAEGRAADTPFRVAASGALTPALWRFTARGRANGIDFATAEPLRIVPEQAGYQIMPGAIAVADGRVQLAGRYGEGLTLETRLDRVNLAVLNPLLPGLGLGGRASGSLDWEQPSLAALPRAEARLSITRFTRTSVGQMSQPVDVSLVGRLLPEGGSVRAVVQRRGATVGRLQVELKPLPPGAANWTERLMGAPLSGGLRYNGPAEMLFSLAALPDQSLMGNIGVAADFAGRLDSPQITGVVRANDLVYENENYGTRLTQIRLRGEFTNDQLDVSEMTARAGDGTISGSGFVNLSSAKGFPVQLNLDLDRARIARSDMIDTAATGQISVTNTQGGDAVVSGTLQLPRTRFKLIRQEAVEVRTLTGVRRKSPVGRPRETGDADPISTLPSNWKLDIRLQADDELYVSGMGLESEWRADLRITGTSGAPLISGDMALVRGTLGFAGRSFELESGRLNFNGGAATNPSLRIAAASVVDGTTVRVLLEGTGERPEITFASTPALPQDEILARILFGNSVAELSALQAVQLAASLNSLRGGAGGLDPVGVLQSAAGIDRLRVLGADQDNGRGIAVALGQYITNDVYVEIVTDARGYTASQIEISLTPALSLLSQVSSLGGSNFNVRYRKDY